MKIVGIFWSSPKKSFSHNLKILNHLIDNGSISTINPTTEKKFQLLAKNIQSLPRKLDHYSKNLITNLIDQQILITILCD
jgi:hypothetical protein